jgi:hypothetical protein
MRWFASRRERNRLKNRNTPKTEILGLGEEKEKKVIATKSNVSIKVCGITFLYDEETA